MQQLKMSYMVGCGPNFLTRINHKGSFLPSLARHPQEIGHDEGFQQFYSTPNPNHNILVGAIVGGPHKDDVYSEDRTGYSHSEMATYKILPLLDICPILQEVTLLDTSINRCALCR